MWLLWWALGWLWDALRATVGSLGPPLGSPLKPLGQPRGVLGSHFSGFVGPKWYTNCDGTLTRFRYRYLGTFLTSPWLETCIFQGSEPLVCMRRASVFTMSTVFRSRAFSRSPQSVFHFRKVPFLMPEAHFLDHVGGLGRTLGLFGEAVQSFGTSRGYLWH